MYRKLNDVLIASAENVPKVYDSGHKVGFEEGKQAEYDAFWDNYQQNGNRTDYRYAFSYKGWNNETFKPKYPIIAKGAAAYMFDSCGLTDFDFVENGIVLDTSEATSLTYLFRGCGGIKRVGEINGTGCKDLNRLFYFVGIETIDKLVVNENVAYDNTFDGANMLVNITISGVIGKNGFLAVSKVLSKASIESIINALSTTTSGLTVTLSKVAVNNAFGINVDDASTYPEGSEYYNLRNSKPNWTISYA